MFNFGAFAGGLAEGARSGQNMAVRRKQGERAAKADEREAEMHQASMDKAAFNRDKRDRLRAANDEIAEGWRQAIRQESMPSVTFKPDQSDPGSGAPDKTGHIFRQSAKSLSMGGLQSRAPATVAGSNPAGNIANAGLMSQYKNPASQESRDKMLATKTTDETANEMIGRRMLTGDLLDDPDELTRMASIYKKHGLLKEMMPWMNRVFEAKKKRIPDALSYLLTGDPKSARAILKKGGLDLADDPVSIDPEDQHGHSWRFRWEDGGVQDINLRDLVEKFFPEKTLKEHPE
jgi:hypothetical protein